MMKLIRRLARLRCNDDGVAAIEFALWSTAFFFMVMAAMDFGSFYLQRGNMNEAVGAAAVASFNDADNVNFANLPGYVRGLTGEQTTTVITACNGTAGSCTNLNRSCACLKNDGTYVTATCGNLCVGTGMTAGSTAGYYLTINASRAYSPMILPQSALAGSTVAQHATVRLQ